MTPPALEELVEITRGMRNNPFPFYALARETAPVVYIDEIKAWNVFRYRDVNAILRNPALYANDQKRLFNLLGRLLVDSTIGTDSPRHVHTRAQLGQFFAAERIARLGPRIRQIANGLVESVVHSGGIDAVEDLAVPLPLVVIGELLGVSPGDYPLLKSWSNQMSAQMGMGFTEESGLPDQLDHAQTGLIEYFSEQIERHRDTPDDDLICELLKAQIDGAGFTHDELVALCILLLGAGQETTTNLISNSTRCLLEYPHELERLRDDRSLIPAFVDEVLRYECPAQATVRYAVQTTQLAGQTISAGEPIVLWIGSANRDPDEFPDPDRFDITRQPNRHLGFGMGMHGCLGALLARAEAQAATESLLRYIPHFQLVDGVQLEPVDGFVMHGVKHLPLDLGRAPEQPKSAETLSPMTVSYAPTFTLTHVTGQQVSLTDYRGQPLVLMFGGQGSQQQMDRIAHALRERFSHDEVPMIGIPDLHRLPKIFHPMATARLADMYRQTATAEAALLRQMGKLVPDDLSHMVVIAPDWSGEVVASFGVTGTDKEATAIVIDTDGSIKGRASGPDAPKRVLALLTQNVPSQGQG